MYIYLRKKKENSNKWFSKIAFVIFKFRFYLLNYCLCIKQFRCVPVFHEINEKCVVEAIFSPILPYQLVILPFENTKRKETDQETMNFLPIFISFEFNDFHDYKVLINSFPVYVFFNTSTPHVPTIFLYWYSANNVVKFQCKYIFQSIKL